LFNPFDNAVRVDVEEAVIADTAHSDYADIVSRKVLRVLLNFGKRYCGLAILIPQNAALRQRMNGDHFKTALQLRGRYL
jgi:hypothetical protein